MVIDVDLGGAPPAVAVLEPDDLGRFHVAVRGGRDAARLGDALAAGAVGRVEGDHVFVDPDAVRRLAEGSVADGWDAGFAAMLEFAASRGWLDGRGAIRAHVEWVDEGSG